MANFNYETIDDIEAEAKATPHGLPAMYQLRALNLYWGNKNAFTIDDPDAARRRAKEFAQIPEHAQTYPTLVNGIKLLKQLGHLWTRFATIARPQKSG